MRGPRPVAGDASRVRTSGVELVAARGSHDSPREHRCPASARAHHPIVLQDRAAPADGSDNRAPGESFDVTLRTSLGVVHEPWARGPRHTGATVDPSTRTGRRRGPPPAGASASPAYGSPCRSAARGAGAPPDSSTARSRTNSLAPCVADEEELVVMRPLLPRVEGVEGDDVRMTSSCARAPEPARSSTQHVATAMKRTPRHGREYRRRLRFAKLAGTTEKAGDDRPVEPARRGPTPRTVGYAVWA